MATAAPPRPTKKADAAPFPVILLDFPERIERLECPDIYAPHWIDVVTNQPDETIADLTLGATIAQAVRGWSFRLQNGQPAPVDDAQAIEGMIVGLPPDLQTWLLDEFRECRRRPLAQRVGSSPTPTT